MQKNVTDFEIFEKLEKQLPDAIAYIKGSAQYPSIYGAVKLFQDYDGVYTAAAIYGLPQSDEKCANNIFAFHIHNGAGCFGDKKDSFSSAGTHYNPTGCPHPYHSGDLPPLFSNDGTAWTVFLTNRFRAAEVIGLPVIIHSMPDDFTSQPSGNSGEKIACGVFQKTG